jgi:Cu-Zn family superoxide dismutase
MRKTKTTAAILTLGLTIGLAACGSPDTQEGVQQDDAASEATVRTAVAVLQTADGQAAGTATATATGDQLTISLEVEGLPAGEHGVHVHTTGACDAPTFTSAGPHWNPAERQHGLENPDGQHAGDMPNLNVAEDGTGSLEYTLAGGATFEGLMDADGSAFMVHATADDQVTDPSGDSGDRIACGVFQAN